MFIDMLKFIANIGYYLQISNRALAATPRGHDMWLKAVSLMAFKEAAEVYMVKLLEDSHLCHKVPSRL